MGRECKEGRKRGQERVEGEEVGGRGGKVGVEAPLSWILDTPLHSYCIIL